MSFKNHSMIHSSYNSQVLQQCSQRKCRFSQTVLQWFQVLPGLLLALPGDPTLVVGTLRLLAGAPRLVAGARRCSQVHSRFSPALRGVLKLITITLMSLRFVSSEIPVTPKAGWNALVGSNTLLTLMHLSLHSTSSQTLLKASSD